MAEIVKQSAKLDGTTLRIWFTVLHARHEAGHWYRDHVDVVGTRPGDPLSTLVEVSAERQVPTDLDQPTKVDVVCPDITLGEAELAEVVISTQPLKPTGDTARERHARPATQPEPNRRRWFKSLALPVAVFGLLGVSPPDDAHALAKPSPQTSTTAGCPAGIETAEARIDQLLDEGELRLAERYVDTIDADYDCVEPLRRLIAEQRERVDVLVDDAEAAAEGGEPTVAVDLYFDVLELDATNADARTAIAELLDPPDDGDDDPFARARELLAAGFTDEARAETARQLTESDRAEAADIGDDLQAVLPASQSWTWADPSTWYVNVPEPIRAFFRPPLVVIPFLLLVVVLLRLITRVLTPERRHEPIDKPLRLGVARWIATWRPTRWLVRPVVVFNVNSDATGDVEVGPTLRDAVYAALVRDGGRLRLGAADTGDVAGALKDLEIGVDPLDNAAKIAAVLMRRRSIDVSLTLEPQRAGHVGVSVAVTDWRGDTFDVTRAKQIVPTDNAGEKDLGEAYMSLSPAVTAFLAFALAEIWQVEHRTDEPVEFAGTSSPESYAAYLSGLRLQGRNEIEPARKSYYAALDLDGTNTFAALNIGSIDTRKPTRLDNALVMLDRASTAAMPGRDNFRRWVRVEYLRSVTYLHRALLQWKPECPDTGRASLESDDARRAEAHADHFYRCLAARCATSRTESCSFEHRHSHAHADGTVHDEKHRHRVPALDRQIDLEFALRHLSTARSLLLSIRVWRGSGTGAAPPLPESPELADWEEYFMWRIGEEHEDLWRPTIEGLPVSSYSRYNLLCGFASASTFINEQHPDAAGYAKGLVDLAFATLSAVYVADPDMPAEWLEEDPALAPLRVSAHQHRWKQVVAGPPTAPTSESAWTIVTHR